VFGFRAHFTRATLRLGLLTAAAGLATAVQLAPSPVSAQPANRDIVDTAVAAGQFNTLAQLVQQAGLVDTLKGPGPFTVFAPTDAAFAKVPQATLQQLQSNPEALRAVLTYHVVPGRVTAADVSSRQSAATVQGEQLQFMTSGGGVRVNNASVVQADVAASNGVIHVVDSVLLPPTIAQAAQLPRTGEGDVNGALPLALAAGLLVIAGFTMRLGMKRAS
jgi:uncharacterized surface protein with fasciclin (FAS1) repeats